MGLIGTYTDLHILIAYSDGEVRQEFTFVYAAEIESGELKIDDESKEAAWLPLSSAVDLPVAASQRRRLKDEIDLARILERQNVLQTNQVLFRRMCLSLAMVLPFKDSEGGT